MLGGAGEGDAVYAVPVCMPEDLLKKRELHLNYYQKHIENYNFMSNVLNKKVC
jgi:hypothetical protein